MTRFFNKALGAALTLVLCIASFAGAQTLGNTNGQGPFAPGAAYSYNQFLGPFFQNPYFSFNANSLVVSWTQGSVYFGNGYIVINPGSVTLTASKTTCSRANIVLGTDSCNYVYSNSSGTVAVTTAISTALSGGNSLLALATTNASGVLTLEAPYQDTSGAGGGAVISGQFPIAASCTPTATSASIQTVGQTCTFTGIASGDLINAVNYPAPTSLCPMTGARATATNTITLYFTVLTAAACTPAAGTYTFLVTR